MCRLLRVTHTTHPCFLWFNLQYSIGFRGGLEGAVVIEEKYKPHSFISEVSYSGWRGATG